MTFPFELHIGILTIPAHPILEFLAFTFGYWYYTHLSKKSRATPLSPDARWAVIVGMAVGALLGSRLIAALENPALFFDPPSILYYFTSKTVAGGFFGGIIGVEIAKKIIGIKRRTGDFFVFPVILATMIGRLGCFLTGVTDGTVGNPSNVPWALDQGDGILRHPTSAYEIVLCLVMFVSLKIADRYRTQLKLREGDLFAIFILAYFLYRFFVEFIKPSNPIFLNLNSIQVASLIAVLYYCYFFIKRIWSPQN